MTMRNDSFAGWGQRLNALLVLAVLVSLSGLGCSGTIAPRLEVLDATVTESSSEAVVVSFLIEMENPNDQPLQLREFRYAVSVDGEAVFEAVRSAEATLPQHSTQTMLLPGVIPFSVIGGMRGGTAVCVISGEVSYVAPGQLAEILFDAEIHIPKAGFSGAQSVELSAR